MINPITPINLIFTLIMGFMRIPQDEVTWVVYKSY